MARRDTTTIQQVSWPGATRPRHSAKHARHGLCLAIQFCIVIGEGYDTASPDTATWRLSVRVSVATKAGSFLRYDRRGCDTARPCARHRELQVPCDTAPMHHDKAPMHHDTAPMRHDTAPMCYDTAPMRHDTADASLRHVHDTAGEGATIRSGRNMLVAWAMGVCIVHSTQFWLSALF